MRNKTIVCILAVCLLIGMMLRATVGAQEKIPREYVPESGVISLAKNTPFNIALKALNEYSLRLEGKPIIDLAQRTNPIGVDIAHLSWKTALELITRTSGLTFIETETYIQIKDEAGAAGAGAHIQAGQAPSIARKPIDGDLQEIRISATFFDADRRLLRESGVNWHALLNRGRTMVDVRQNTVGEVTPEDLGALEVWYSGDKTELSAVVKAMENRDIGEVLASPQITVIDGREGRVQVGQDFSIKQRDFAGNVMDYFISAGIILTVTPNIIEEDSLQYVHLTVEAERSSASPGNISTVINKTETTTQLLLNDGEEAVIGGLYSTEEYTIRNGIPILKDIPRWFFGLGYVFGFESVSHTEKELIILLKAEIVPTLQERLAAIRERGG